MFTLALWYGGATWNRTYIMGRGLLPRSLLYDGTEFLYSRSEKIRVTYSPAFSLVSNVYFLRTDKSCSWQGRPTSQRARNPYVTSSKPYGAIPNTFAYGTVRIEFFRCGYQHKPAWN